MPRLSHSPSARKGCWYAPGAALGAVAVFGGPIFDLVGDIERYPDFLPWCRNAHVVSNGNGEVVAELTIMKGASASASRHAM
jgi:hypothetical protein